MPQAPKKPNQGKPKKRMGIFEALGKVHRMIGGDVKGADKQPAKKKKK